MSCRCTPLNPSELRNQPGFTACHHTYCIRIAQWHALMQTHQALPGRPITTHPQH